MRANFSIFMVMLWSLLIRALLQKRRDQEIMMLRKELQVLRRQLKKPQFNKWDRLFFISLFKANASAVNNAVTLKPSTIIAWHKKLIRRKWDYSDKKRGRPSVSGEFKELILDMKQANLRWGCRKIQGELRKLGIIVSKSTIAKILAQNGFSPAKKKFERTWLNFLSNHTKRYLACDFMVVDTLFLERLYVFSVMDVTSRKIILFNVTANPTAIWLETVVRSGFCLLEDLPGVIISDRDGIYGNWFGEFLKDSFDMKLIRTPPRTPNCNAFIERWHRSFREEVLDHCLIFGIRDLKKITQEFITYYHTYRPHQGLGQDSPLKNHSTSQNKVKPKIRRSKMVDGIITNFELAA